MTYNCPKGDKCDTSSSEFRNEKTIGLKARALEQILSVQAFENLCTVGYF